LTLHRTVLINLAGYAHRAWSLALLAAAVFAVLTATPLDSYALVNAKTEVSYQDNETDNGNMSTSSIQERFSAILNTDSVFSSKLRMTGLFRFDVLQRDNETTSITRSANPSPPPNSRVDTTVNATESTELAENLPNAWYDTPNIHFCTIRDFVTLGREMNLQVERGLALNGDGRPLRLDPAGVAANLLAEQAVFLLRRS